MSGTGLEKVASAKSDLWKHEDTDWAKWMVVSAAPTRIYFESWSDEERGRFYDDFDPDHLDMWSGQAMNRGDFFRMRGTAVNSTMEYEWQELINPVYGHQAIFQGNGIARKEDGSIAARWFKPGVTPPCMCHMAPLWHTVATQGMVRTGLYGDSLFQDNIANPIYTWNHGFCDWCNKRFIDFIVEKFNNTQLTKLGFDPGSFKIRNYLAAKRKEAGEKKESSAGQYFQEEYTSHNANDLLLTDPIIREYIRFQHISYLLYWIDAADKSKQTAMKLDKSIPACYGNIPRVSGLRTYPTIMASQVDIVWSEESSDMQPCFRDERQAWSALLYKFGRAASYYDKPVVSVQYQGGDKSIYDEPGKKRYPTAIACSEAVANGGVFCQTWAATEYYYLKNNPGWEKPFYETHQKHASFAGKNRALFTDRTAVAEVALVYSFPTTFWREFQSLKADTPHKDIFSAVARILEDNHIPYQIMPFGHKDVFDDSYFFDRINNYKTIIIPNADCISIESEKKVTEWVKKGGNLLLLGKVGIFDEELNLRSKKAFAEILNDGGPGSVTAIDYEDTYELTYGKDILPVSKTTPRQWKYVFDKPDIKWSGESFDDSKWQAANAPFGDRETRGTQPQTKWDSNEIWMRCEFSLDEKLQNPILFLQHWWEVEIYINGTLAAARDGRGYHFEPYQYLKITSDGQNALRKGKNIIAVRCRRNEKNPTYGQFIDVGIRDLASDQKVVEAIRSANAAVIETNLPKTVWLNVWHHGGGQMMSVQMVNYDVDFKNDQMNAVDNFFVRLKKTGEGKYAEAFYYANDFDGTASATPQRLSVKDAGDFWEVEMPRLVVFGALVFAAEDELQARATSSEARKYLERLKISQRCNGATLDNKELIAKAAGLLSQIQGNVKVADYNTITPKLTEMAGELKTALDKSAREIEQYQKRLATDVFDVEAVYKFDFGGKNAPQGWLAVTPETIYSQDNGYGWVEKGQMQVIDTVHPDAVHGDYIRSLCFDGKYEAAEPEASIGRFKIDCENGKYFVTVITGNYGVFNVRGTASEGRTSMTFVKANGELKLLGDSLYSGYFENRSFTADVTDGSLVLEFYGKNIGPLYSSSVQWLVNGLLIQNAQQKPTAAATEYFNKNQSLSSSAIREWAILAPFEDSSCIGMESELDIDRDLRVTMSENKKAAVKWKNWQHQGNGFPVVYFDELLPDSLRAIGFAKTYIYSQHEQDVFIRGSFSQFGRIYLNKNEVYRDDLAVGLTAGEIKVKVSLQAGWNEMILKNANYWGREWSFWMGLISADGQDLKDIKISSYKRGQGNL